MARKKAAEVVATEKPAAKGRSWRSKLLTLKVIVIALLVVGLVAAGGTLYLKYSNLQKENQRLTDPQEAAKEQTKQLKQDVGKLLDLPNEDPTIATVTDAAKLRNQAFFSKAENGDKVLIFTQAKKAVLYRPSTKKIIEVAPINIGNNQNQQ